MVLAPVRAGRRFFCALQGRRQRLLGNRLDQIVGHAGAGQLAIERDVVDLADADQARVLGERRGQRQHGAQRRTVVADVDDQHAGCRRFGEEGEGVGGVPIAHHRLVEELLGYAGHDLMRLAVADEGDAFGSSHLQWRRIGESPEGAHPPPPSVPSMMNFRSSLSLRVR
jgi:hypothetical protein